MSRSSVRALRALILARVVLEAVAFACLATLADFYTGGTLAVALPIAALAIAGVSLLVVAGLREAMTERRAGIVVACALVVSLVLAVGLPARDLDATAMLGRLIVFALIAEAYVWRTLTIARGAMRWEDTRRAVAIAASAITLAAVLPALLDRSALPYLALAVVAAAAVALALARATEELSLIDDRSARGSARLDSLTSTLVVLGLASVAVAAIAPFAERVLADAAGAIGEALATIAFYLLLPFGFVAAFFVDLLRPLIRGVDLTILGRSIRPMTPEEQEAATREIERNRPIVAGAIEAAFVLAVLVVALFLLERVVRDRRLTLPRGGDLGRSSTDGMSLRETLGLLRPRRPARRRRPRDDGTPAAALRLAYWRLLELTERAGLGWREPGETPAEHHRRVAARDTRFAPAAPLVGLFEDLRYGERDVDRAAATRAREIIRSVEAAVRT